jgi:hypothetical protein
LDFEMQKKFILRSVLTMLGVVFAATLGMVWFRGPVQRTQRWKQISLDSSQSVLPQVRLVDTAFHRWSEAEKVSLAEQADWLTVCRRLALGLVGSGMSLEEIRQLEQWPVSERASIPSTFYPIVAGAITFPSVLRVRSWEQRWALFCCFVAESSGSGWKNSWRKRKEWTRSRAD